jgi:two-component system, sensor histidine kinase
MESMSTQPEASYSATPPTRADADKIFATQIDTLYKTAMPGVLGALAAAVILISAFVIQGELRPGPGFLWGGLLAACVAFHAAIRLLYDWRSEHSSVRLWATLFTVASLMDGLWWGGATIVLPAADRFDQQALVIALALIVAAGAVPAFAMHLPALLVIFLPISLITAAWQAMQTGVLHQTIVVLIAVFIGTILSLGRRTHANLTEMISLRFERERLVEDLRLQIERAEQANAAKSRFLASASHDLRQPVHALSMFVGALARHAMTPDVQSLVAHIKGSTQAMESLLGSILDISKLDAGVIDPRHEAFPIGPMLERICAEQTRDANVKGLALKACRTSAFVNSDPVLLERILRNLISNAVRYTDRGRVLVGCRRGETLRIEIWDTGRGIASADHERVFEEFFQVGNPERDRSQGLGLGLSIVRRLTALLGHRLELASTPAKGSVFRLYVQAAAPSTTVTENVGDQAAPANDLSGVVIAVVDDDSSVLEGIRILLSGWGARVIAAVSGEELIARLKSECVRPDIALCDFRLRAGEDGIEVIHRLHSFLTEAIPAVLITGDTASERVRLAYDSGFHVLHKPIAPGRLRALIGNLLRHREAVI